MLDLQTLIDSIPDSFREGKESTGNIYRILKVFVQEINKEFQTLQDIADLTDISNLAGQNLTEYAKGFGLTRGNKSDSELRLEVEAFRARSVIGADIEAILSFFRLLLNTTGSNVRIKNKFDSDLANPRPLAFDLILEPVTAPSIPSYLAIAKLLKAGGIDVSINETKVEGFLTQGNGDYLTQANGDKIIIEPGNI